jgi:6,7-dimethyl-8-ribityllumazine synthase
MQRKNYAKKIVLPDGSKLRIGIVVSAFNKDITENMLTGALSVLDGARVKKANVNILRVPGSFEIPYGCLKLIQSRKPHAVIALGCIIKGETTHDQYIASAAAGGIMDVMLDCGAPISFGIITTNNLKQAKVRSTGETNKGREAAVTALEMALM